MFLIPAGGKKPFPRHFENLLNVGFAAGFIQSLDLFTAAAWNTKLCATELCTHKLHIVFAMLQLMQKESVFLFL